MSFPPQVVFASVSRHSSNPNKDTMLEASQPPHDHPGATRGGEMVEGKEGVLAFTGLRALTLLATAA